MKKSILILLLGASITTLVGMQQKKDFFELTKTLQGHTDRVNSVIELDPGKIASGSDDHTIKIWNIHSNQPLKTLQNNSRVHVLLKLKDGRIAAILDNYTINIWNIDSGQIDSTLHHRSIITSIIELEDGTIASGSWNGTIRIWDITSGQQIRQLNQNHVINALLELPDGRIVACTAFAMHATITIWNLSSGQPEYTKELQREIIREIIALQDGNIAVINGSNVDIWDAHFETRLKTLQGELGFYVFSITELQDGRLASGSVNSLNPRFDSSTIKIWDIQSGTTEQTLQLEGHRNYVRSVIQLEDSSILSGSENGTIQIWSPVSGSSNKTKKTSKECRGESSSSSSTQRKKIK